MMADRIADQAAMGGQEDPLCPSTESSHTTATLAHVNTPPAQTWNYLRVNNLTLTLPAQQAAGEVHARLPHVFDCVETAIGDEALHWIEDAAGDARYVEVRAGEHRAEPIVMAVSEGDRIDAGVLVREGASVTIVVTAANADGAKDAGDVTPSATALRVIAERDSHVNVIESVAMTDGRTHMGGIGISAADGAVVEVRQYALGRGTTALGIATKLTGTGARLTHTMRYLAREGDLLDASHLVRMHGRGTKADVIAQGVLAEGACKTLRETIDLAHGAKGAQGNEAETVLVTGEHVINKTLPTILCDEEDVAGNHGASIGAISQEQLAYLADRGIDGEAAEALFVRATFDDALIHAPTTELRQAVLTRAADVLGAEVAAELVEGLVTPSFGEGDTHAERH